MRTTNKKSFVIPNSIWNPVILLLLSSVIILGLSGCNKKTVGNETAINMPVQNSNSNDEKSVSSENGLETNQPIKLAGQDENGWNVYQTEEFGFEIKAPSDCYYINKSSEGIRNTFHFGCFYINNIKNKSNNSTIETKDDLVQILCDSFAINDKEACKAGRDGDMIQFDIEKSKGKNLIKTIELDGVPLADGTPTSVAIIYYFVSKDNIFYIKKRFENIKEISNEQIELFEKIVLTFKF